MLLTRERPGPGLWAFVENNKIKAQQRVQRHLVCKRLVRSDKYLGAEMATQFVIKVDRVARESGPKLLIEHFAEWSAQAAMIVGARRAALKADGCHAPDFLRV